MCLAIVCMCIFMYVIIYYGIGQKQGIHVKRLSSRVDAGPFSKSSSIE